MSPARQAAPLRAAFSLFTVIPVAGPVEIRRDTAARALLWLPVLGGLLAAVAAGTMLAVEAGGHSGPRRLLAATIAVAVLEGLTGGLHLDGLADTVDGLGSRRPRAEALDIMRKSDIGPLGVSALLLVVLLQVTSLATVAPGGPDAVALLTAVITSRVAVIVAAGSPAARPGGFGALIAGTTSMRVKVVAVVALLAVVTTAGAAVGGAALAVRCLAAVAVGLIAAALVHRAATSRLGGMTGDVFGALIEISTAAVLLVLALSG
jgi:adenosylcobinamide-GDP ribazoletransferase